MRSRGRAVTPEDGPADAERLRIAAAERGLLVRDAAVSGRVVAANSPTLYAPFGGTVALDGATCLSVPTSRRGSASRVGSTGDDDRDLARVAGEGFDHQALARQDVTIARCRTIRANSEGTIIELSICT